MPTYKQDAFIQDVIMDEEHGDEVGSEKDHDIKQQHPKTGQGIVGLFAEKEVTDFEQKVSHGRILFPSEGMWFAFKFGEGVVVAYQSDRFGVTDLVDDFYAAACFGDAKAATCEDLFIAFGM